MDVLILDCGDDIKGECTLPDFTNKIELLSYSHGVAQQITGDQSNQKRTSGKPNHQDFTVTKFMDLSTCSLIDVCNQATLIPSVKVTVAQTEAGKTVAVITYTMTNALVSSISVGGGGGGKPQETVTFNYTKIQWDYKQQLTNASDAGNKSAKWSLETNKAE
ncbi:MAG TPA: type VI secretion system tube protein Hcp [Terriglobales bacterium]|nr:type VI secretion system tube protein Hcp [Terriglobales bacterium]